MKTGTKIAIGLGVLGAAVGGIVIAARKPAVPPGPVPASSVPPGLPGSNAPGSPGSDTPDADEGWTTYGWYTYKGASNEKMWIRVDKGPETGTVLVDLPWRWSIFVDRTDASGYVPIASGEDSWTNLFGRASETYVEYDDERMAAKVARAAAEQIDAMYSGAA